MKKAALISKLEKIKVVCMKDGRRMMNPITKKRVSYAHKGRNEPLQLYFFDANYKNSEKCQVCKNVER